MLNTSTPLNGFSAEINNVSINEVTGRAIVSVAMPRGGEAKFKSAIKKELKLDLPEPGAFTSCKTANGQLVWASEDQFFYLFDENDLEPEKAVKSKLGASAYVTNQSDAFVMLSVSGDRRLEALERICPIDLDTKTFSVGSAARTMMEHIGALILRSSDNEYVLLSASSSAGSFLHAVETSAKNLS